MCKRRNLGWMIVMLELVMTVSAAGELPLVDAHIHHSHDAWEVLSPAAACTGPPNSPRILPTVTPNRC